MSKLDMNSGLFTNPLLNRRQMLRRFANGFGMLGLSSLLAEDFLRGAFAVS